MGDYTKLWMPQAGMVVGLLAGVHLVRVSGDYLLTQIALIVVSCLTGVVLAAVVFKLWRVWRHKEKWYYALDADIFGGDANIVAREIGGAEANESPDSISVDDGDTRSATSTAG